MVMRTWCEHVVDELQEALLGHVSVSEQEHGPLILNAQFKV